MHPGANDQTCCRQHISDTGRRPLAMRRGIGVQLLAARKRAKLTQTEVARRMGTKHSSISRVESGRVRASIDFLERYARALGTPVTITFGNPLIPDLAERWERARLAFRRIALRQWGLIPHDARRIGLTTPEAFDPDQTYAFAIRFIAHSADPLFPPCLVTPDTLEWPTALASIWYDGIDWERARQTFDPDPKAWRTDIRVRTKVRNTLAARPP